MLTRIYTCILCPNSCEITVEYEGKTLLNAQGNRCGKGLEYVTQELTDPQRTVTSSVLVTGGDRPLVSVRLTAPICRDLIFPLMAQLKTMVLPAPVDPGQILLKNVFGTNADLIATSRVCRASGDL